MPFGRVWPGLGPRWAQNWFGPGQAWIGLGLDVSLRHYDNRFALSYRIDSNLGRFVMVQASSGPFGLIQGSLGQFWSAQVQVREQDELVWTHVKIYPVRACLN